MDTLPTKGTIAVYQIQSLYSYFEAIAVVFYVGMQVITCHLLASNYSQENDEPSFISISSNLARSNYLAYDHGLAMA